MPIEILPLEVQKEGLDAFELVGTDVREVLERRSASTVVVQFLYKKFVRKDRDLEETTVVFSPDTVEMPIARGLAGPGTLADTIVRRWQDHQPLNRLEDIYGREGLDLARSTICTWHEQLGELVAPVVEAMFADALGAPYLCVDATGVLVLAKEQCRSGHFWVLVAPEKHVLYGYSKRHDSAAVDELLRGYKGYLVADAHTVYDHIAFIGRFWIAEARVSYAKHSEQRVVGHYLALMADAVAPHVSASARAAWSLTSTAGSMTSNSPTRDLPLPTVSDASGFVEISNSGRIGRLATRAPRSCPSASCAPRS